MVYDDLFREILAYAKRYLGSEQEVWPETDEAKVHPLLFLLEWDCHLLENIIRWHTE